MPPRDDGVSAVWANLAGLVPGCIDAKCYERKLTYHFRDLHTYLVDFQFANFLIFASSEFAVKSTYISIFLAT